MTWFEVGNSLINISSPDETWRQTPEASAPDLVMKAYVEDLDNHFARAKADGAKTIVEPQDGFWGGRIYRALDHEGHQWEISERLPGSRGRALATASRRDARSSQVTKTEVAWPSHGFNANTQHQ
ncbi:MAG: VOC family protein [Acidobacteria bacterium]|nr:VOC family protein [Acidobacteriota bacterium]